MTLGAADTLWIGMREIAAQVPALVGRDVCLFYQHFA